MMARAQYRLRVDDDRYGHICPVCAGPKTDQAARCKACYRDAQLAGLARDAALRGPEHPRYIDGRRMAGVSRAKGGTYGRPQPQDHPWRKAEKLRLARIAA